MQSKSRPLDDLTNLATNAVGALKGVAQEEIAKLAKEVKSLKTALKKATVK